MNVLSAAHDHLIAAVVATANLAVGLLVALPRLMGAEVPDGALIAATSLIGASVVGIGGWAIVMLVQIGQLVAGLKEQAADHERRIEHLEGP